MAFFRAAIGGGGGGGSASGTIPDVSGTSQTFTVDTGLASINRFVAWGQSTANGHTCIAYDKSVSQTNYQGVGMNGTNVGYYNSVAFGTAIHVSCPQIVSVVGGVVTIKTSTYSGSRFTNGWWMAC